MQVYLIRHGESEANAAGVHSGWRPVKLTALGRRQAQGTARLIAGVAFDEIIVSDLVRAQETARIIFPERTFTLCSDIRELDTSPLAGRKVSVL
ncbi:MAG: histidine phosphatase family protein, partial [Clostridia bacterium]|nr:histidine phosphatase family protein [Clostridia bacterium]